MAISFFPHVELTAVSTVLPSGSISLYDELDRYGNNPDKARRFHEASGFFSRRVAPPDVTAGDMCIQAAEGLLVETGVGRSEVGAVLFAAHSPDYLLPATASLAQHALGLGPACVSLDLNAGCAAFVSALWLGAGMIASRACKRVLVLAGDTPNRFLNPANRIVTPIFGDGGTATLLSRNPEAEGMSFLSGTDGGKHEALIIPGGGSRIPHCADEEPDSPFNSTVADPKGNPWTLGGYGQIWMDGLAVYTFSISTVPPHIQRHLSGAGLAPSDLDFLFLHQANKVILDSLITKLGVAPERAPCASLGKFGNLGGASLPAALCDRFAPADGSNAGPAVIRDAAKTLLCGFGSGLAWSSCLLSLDGCLALPVRDFAPAAPIPSRTERIAYWKNKFSGNPQ